jgi:hypothetical protein
VRGPVLSGARSSASTGRIGLLSPKKFVAEALAAQTFGIEPLASAHQGPGDHEEFRRQFDVHLHSDLPLRLPHTDQAPQVEAPALDGKRSQGTTSALLSGT